ncbi:MAG: hypothetical protein MHMPM18_000882 [Marteilia pararefringens]
MYAAANSAQYDSSVNCFSPEGRLFQVEYACNSINMGAISIALKTKEGLIFAAEKRLPNKLVIPSSITKIKMIDSHLIFCYSGRSPDAMRLLDIALIKAGEHSKHYGEPISVHGMAKHLSEEISSFADFDNEKRLSRVYGCALLIGGLDENGDVKLYFLNPSGSYSAFYAKSIGSGSASCDLDLKADYKEDMTLQEAKVLILNSLKNVMEEKIEVANIDITIMTKEGIQNLNESEKQETLAAIL